MEGKFTLATVIWKDATLYQEYCEKPEMVTVKTAGWIQIQEDKIVVVSSFSDDVPDVFFLIPKEWAVEIIYLREEEDETPKRKTQKS